MSKPVEIGKRLKLFRANITQKDFARTLRISQWSYRLYEIGERMPPVTVLETIAKVYGTTIDYLVTGEEARQKEISLSRQERDELLNRQNGVCAICGFGVQDVLEVTTIDVAHIISKQHKDKFDLDKVVLLCPNCNVMKKKSLLKFKFAEGSVLIQSAGRRMTRRPD